MYQNAQGFVTAYVLQSYASTCSVPHKSTHANDSSVSLSLTAHPWSNTASYEMEATNYDIPSSSHFEEIDWETIDNMPIFPDLQEPAEHDNHMQRTMSASSFDDEWRLSAQIPKPPISTETNQMDFQPAHISRTLPSSADEDLSPKHTGPSTAIPSTRLMPRVAYCSVHGYQLTSNDANSFAADQHTTHYGRLAYNYHIYPYAQTTVSSSQETLKSSPYRTHRSTDAYYALHSDTSGVSHLLDGRLLSHLPDNVAEAAAESHLTNRPVARVASAVSCNGAPQMNVSHASMHDSTPPNQHLLHSQASAPSHVQQHPLPYGFAPGHVPAVKSGEEGEWHLRQSSRQITPMGSSYPAEILTLVSAIKALNTGSNGYPFRKHLKDRSNVLIRQHFCSQLGILRPQSPLRRYIGDLTLFDAEYWAYLVDVQRRPRRADAQIRPGRRY